MNCDLKVSLYEGAISEKPKITVRVKSGFLQVTALNAEREKFYSARAKQGKAFQNILTPCPPLHRNDEHNLLCMHAKSVGILEKKIRILVDNSDAFNSV